MFSKNKNKLFFLLIVGCIFFGWFSKYLYRTNELDETSLSKILAKIPKNDQLILEDFFQDLITRSPFGFNLYGNKPVSSIQYVNPNSDFYFKFRLDPENLKLQKGVECWRKYYKLFPSENYLFKFSGDPSKDKYIEVSLVNKRRFIEVIQKNLSKFQSVSGQNMTAEKILIKYSTEQDFWDNQFDHEMTGILFGYGNTNSYFFQRRADINPKPNGGRFTLKKCPKTPSQGYATIEEEYADISSKLQLLQNDSSLDEGYMDLPGFLAIPDSEETVTIKNDYIRTRKKMIKLFRDGDFFKKSMRRYTQRDSKVGQWQWRRFRFATGTAVGAADTAKER